jgi:O-acetyl-ADP-ribose deacetylase (regulator of RNase III)
MSTFHYQQGDLLAADAQALVNTVNTVGVMGKGIALQFKKTFPDNYQAYRAACESGQLTPGEMFVFDTNLLIPRFIVNFPTKRHWRENSRVEDIQSGLSDLVEVIKKRQIGSIAIPPLGCGLGNLHWEEVKPLIMESLQPLPDLHVMLFEPAPTGNNI